ncbi:uncharacterized protein (DUF1800 family) [Sphingomonas kyeonggiensis]|uniref:Uncharacterized protein (DUF1800 family) n=1 Tax=Sphingomonas kyeonggiensis TaxID=1268553 RepID=A0A7W7K6E2_9SPHN|nr:DUF1800 domain-containing protein [Sphingomonas kyeonggiensis]MBB4841386.1 uncharacterized protein (DUF1800 family) [Sphingomonas kyeonggiensis]
MSDASIARNRFGLGARPGEDVGSDPRKWLAGQIAAFDPRPQAIAAQASSAQVASELADFYERQRLLRLENPKPKPAAVAPAKPAGVQPAMAEGMAMQDMQAAAPAMQGAPAAKPVYQGEDAAMIARREARRVQQQAYVGMVSARALTAITSPTPFAERLVHFWANHFAVSADKLELVGLSGTMEFEAIRPHVMGKFGDMLNAVERHPAMLLYLDQAVSVGPNSAVAQRQRGRRSGLNENLAREIMELHTLGVRSVYTQADVTEFARAMTGFTVAGIGRGPGARYVGAADGQPGSFLFADRMHEPGTRTILGKQWSAQGEEQASEVLDYLATHPATAKHIATKLARHFASDDPPAPLVARLQKAFLSSGGDLPTVYRALIASPECWSPTPAKFKSPWEWSISAMRALGTQQVQPQAVNGLMGQLGQPTWKPGSPAGWDDVAGAWAGPDAVMRRVEAAERMAARAKDTIDARQRAAELFPGTLTPSTTQSIARAESPGQGLALMLVSPEFMRR